ncbi:hypothetical protein [Shinella sp. CPCC 101442]|nr:hypothetical protein [Shinella sp. CPCC 101442]
MAKYIVSALFALAVVSTGSSAFAGANHCGGGNPAHCSGGKPV